jgi:hypothetical protein
MPREPNAAEGLYVMMLRCVSQSCPLISTAAFHAGVAPTTPDALIG